MDEINYPTWQSVGLPEQFVAMLSSPKTSVVNEVMLEGLIFDRVFHHVRKLQYVYHCGVCGHSYKAEKSIEDYTACENCKSHAIRATQYLCAPKRNHPPGCLGGDGFAQEILAQMRDNYVKYFGRPFSPDEIVNMTWKHRTFECKFLGGDAVEDVTMTRAICRASLFVPFLWDTRFDWKEGRRRERGREFYFLPILHDWVQRGQPSR